MASCSPKASLLYYQISVFACTYLCYCCFHFGRQSWSVLKFDVQTSENTTAQTLGTCDSIFLGCYSVGLFFVGPYVDRYNTLMFLNLGLVLMASLMLLIAFTGIGWQTYILFALNGFAQSVGYPACFAIVSQWFSSKTRGTVLGIWASCGSCGNVLGALITESIMNKGFQWEGAYAITGSISYGWAIVNCIFAREPEQVGIQILEDTVEDKKNIDQPLIDSEQASAQQTELVPINHEEIPLVEAEVEKEEEKGVTLCQALLFPGVLKNSLNYFCLKFVYYSLVFWLPFYVKSTQENIQNVSGVVGVFEGGTLSGAFLIGFISDLIGGRRYICLWFCILAGSIFTFNFVTSYSMAMVFFVGAFIGGSSLVVQTVQSADIGRQVKGKKSLATIMGIIDGSGSLGACFGQVIVGYMQAAGWNTVFTVFACVSLVSVVLITPNAFREARSICVKPKRED